MAIELRGKEHNLILNTSPVSSRKSKKERLYERAWGCEHPEGCDVTKLNELTIDHFTSRCIAAALGWSKKRANKDENCQLLCLEHHRQKDATTLARWELAKRLREGQVIALDDLAQAGRPPEKKEIIEDMQAA